MITIHPPLRKPTKNLSHNVITPTNYSEGITYDIGILNSYQAESVKKKQLESSGRIFTETTVTNTQVLQRLLRFPTYNTLLYVRIHNRVLIEM